MIIVLPWVHCEWVSMALFCIIFIQIQYTKGYFYSCTLWNWNYCAYCKYKWLKKKMKTGWKTDFLFFLFLSFEIQSIRPCCGFCYLKACYYVKVGILKYIYTCQRFGYREYFHMEGFSMVVRLFTTCSWKEIMKDIFISSKTFSIFRP